MIVLALFVCLLLVVGDGAGSPSLSFSVGKAHTFLLKGETL